MDNIRKWFISNTTDIVFASHRGDISKGVVQDHYADHYQVVNSIREKNLIEDLSRLTSVATLDEKHGSLALTKVYGAQITPFNKDVAKQFVREVYKPLNETRIAEINKHPSIGSLTRNELNYSGWLREGGAWPIQKPLSITKHINFEFLYSLFIKSFNESHLDLILKWIAMCAYSESLVGFGLEYGVMAVVGVRVFTTFIKALHSKGVILEILNLVKEHLGSQVIHHPISNPAPLNDPSLLGDIGKVVYLHRGTILFAGMSSFLTASLMMFRQQMPPVGVLLPSIPSLPPQYFEGTLGLFFKGLSDDIAKLSRTAGHLFFGAVYAFIGGHGDAARERLAGTIWPMLKELCDMGDYCKARIGIVKKKDPNKED